MYILTWKNPAAVSPAKVNVTVPVGSTVANAASLTFTGKGAANYGKVQQENLMRLLENFADSTAPQYPTVGQTWYDTTAEVLKLCTSASPLTWRSLAGVQVTEVGQPAPGTPSLGDLWFERTGTLSGYLYVYSGIGRFPLSGANGGWEQIWPQPDNAALRDEYDEMLGILTLLLGAETTPTFGNGAIGRLYTTLTNFAALDTDLDNKFNSAPDVNISNAATVDLRTQTYSGDWDKLLSAARWAVSRLDVPATLYEDVSPIPFVQDGRQPPSELTSSYMWNDVRFPTFERRTSRRFGLVTMSRLYAETMNVLSIAASNRYNLQGMAGNSGTVATFAADVGQWTHCARSGSFTGGTGTVATIFRWPTDADRGRFIYGGSAIEITIARTPSASPSAADLNFQAFLTKHNRFRITADRTRAMVGATAPYTMAIAASSLGLKNVAETAGLQTLATIIDSSVTLTIQGTRGTGTATVNAVINAPAGLTGTTTVTYRVIKDCTAYNTGTATPPDLFVSPTAYNSTTDSVGTTAVFTNQALPSPGLPPAANFTASSLTATAGGPAVTLTWSGTGAPTLVEWDIDGDGTFDLTGNSVSYVFPTAGVKHTIRVRATNAVGTDVLTRPAYITVS